MREEVGCEMTAGEHDYSFFAASPVPHLILTLGRGVEETNRALCDLLGYRSDEVVGSSVLRVVHPEDMEALILVLDALVRGHDDILARQYRFLHKDGHVVWVEATMSLVRIADEPVAVCMALSDVSALKRIEEFQRVVFEAVDDGVCVVDAHARIVVANPAAARLLGWSEDELRGRGAHDVVHCQSPEERTHPHAGCPLSRALRGDSTVRVTGESFTRRDGTTIKVAYSASPLHGDGAAPGALVVFRPCERDGGSPSVSHGPTPSAAGEPRPQAG